METKNIDISKRIFELMKEHGISQKELSDRTGISTSTISDWKNKGATPNSEKITLICDALHINSDYIFNNKEPETANRKIITEESGLWEFIKTYDTLPAEAQKRILAYAMALMKVEQDKE